jgi:transcription initiation factor TFIID subunit 7
LTIKLYKIADISTLIVIYENKNFNIEEEILRLESSGLTPPMTYVKERRFAKNSVRTEEVEKIEAKVNNLLLKDSKAVKVEIVSNEKESNETDLDMLAAETENTLM